MISQPRNEIQLFKIIISFNACYSNTGLKKIRVNRLYDFYCKLNAACIVEGKKCYFTMMNLDRRVEQTVVSLLHQTALNEDKL